MGDEDAKPTGASWGSLLSQSSCCEASQPRHFPRFLGGLRCPLATLVGNNAYSRKAGQKTYPN